MLIDYRTLDDYIAPALVVAAVFMVGKISANFIGSILAGRRPAEALRVGMTMPQMGEFSLAIGRLSPSDAAGVSALGPVLSLCTAITSVLAPLTSRSAPPLTRWANRRIPVPAHKVMLSVSLGVRIFWSTFSLIGPTGERLREIGRGILINVGIIGMLCAAGTGVLYITPETLGSLFPWPVGITGLLFVGIVIGLSAPSAIRIWHSLGALAYLATNNPQFHSVGAGSLESWRTWRTMVEYGLATVLLGLLFLLSLPFIVRLFTLGSLSVPLSLVLLILPALAVGVFSFRLHLILEPAFRDTFTAEPEDSGP